ncbi:MAG: penicillin-binding transpeptidase domain-containing protein [Bdellovibrionota bacterium]|nr:penicillin-binding transpeptidase domain-containing protein [Bdellovibrionota bacterium]
MSSFQKKIIQLSLVITLGVGGYFFYQGKAEEAKQQLKLDALSFVRDSVTQQVVSENHFPTSIKYNDLDIGVTYTLDDFFQREVESLIKRYANDYTAVVIMDNDSGEILASAGVQRKGREISYGLPFTSTHPSASLFKIITSAELLSQNKIDPSTKLNFRGRGTTLYKYQLKDKISRWTRWISFKKAFAHSNNVIFGKAAIEKTSPQSMFKTAFAFGFNRQLMKDFNLGPSRFIMAESEYQLAELASGFNKKTLISPVHAALLSSVIANGGIYHSPKIIKNTSLEGEKIFFPGVEEKVLDKSSVSDLTKMMELTVQRGTARRISRGRLGQKLKEKLIMGAKTGSITGGIPFGKRDWLTLFAKPRDGQSSGISIAVMNINGKKWYHKSTFLMKKLLKLYLEKLEEEEKDKSLQS